MATVIAAAPSQPWTRRGRPGIGGAAPFRPQASLSPGWGGNVNPYAYDAASPYNPDLVNWLPVNRSPDAEINWDRDRLSARARDLVRNDSWAKGAIQRLLDAAIGARFFPIPAPNLAALARRFGAGFDEAWFTDFKHAIRAEFAGWADDPGFGCDATRTDNFAGLCHTAMRHKLVDGDAVAIVMWDQARRDAGGYATCVQLIAPERLSNPQRVIDDKYHRGGVVIDPCGAPIAYTIQRGHDYDWWSPTDTVTWDEWPRHTACGRPVTVHDFERAVASQHRGTGILAEALIRFRLLNRHDDASLKASLIRATLGLWITSTRDEGDTIDALNTASETIASASGLTPPSSFGYYSQYGANVTLSGGPRLPILAPGDKVQMVGGQGHADDYKTVQQIGHRAIAAATGQATPEISNDYSELNYSSFRGEALTAWKTLVRRRAAFARGTAGPVYAAFVEECCERFPELLPAAARRLPFGDMRPFIAGARWYGPGKGWIDPIKERQGEVLGLDAGFGTLEDTCAEMEGEYYEDRAQQRARERRLFKDLDLPFAEWMGPVPAEQSVTRPQPA